MYKKLFTLVLGVGIFVSTLGHAVVPWQTDHDPVISIGRTRLLNPPSVCRNEDFVTRASPRDQARKDRKGACGQQAGERQVDALIPRFNNMMPHNIQYNKDRNGIDDTSSFRHNNVKYFFSFEYKADTATLSKAQHTLAWQQAAADQAWRQGNISRQTYEEFVQALEENRVIRLVLRTNLTSNNFIQTYGVILSQDPRAYPAQLTAYCTTIHPYFKELYDQSLASSRMRKEFADLNNQCASLASQSIMLPAKASSPNPFAVSPVSKAALPSIRYSRENLGSFLQYLNQDDSFSHIADAVEDSEVSATVLRNLARNPTYGTTERTAEKYKNLWRGLKKEFPTKYKKWKSAQ